MEWCDAGSLAAALSDGRLKPAGVEGDASSFEAICTTLLEVALAMDHLHAMHIMHRDLKAKNVLLSSSMVRLLMLLLRRLALQTCKIQQSLGQGLWA